ncbi:alpha/beta hydrolase [Halopseudomonas nanhaiensis]|uniref:alpha/beta fold hydrolase n=1 Tax=Halopseudomonas nanhaiensis TaxID=2830842 RepID=UPI001CBD1510|nr:alpha/beta hydrolase [Halopseudomonas nanhaiensis]UAW99266.1 alpha/beta hydrolase [Halopseudomonas nanhaiensis]
MMLLPWSHKTSAGFALSGWYSPPTGKPLLHFLHGNGFCGRTYEPFIERLAEHFDLWLCDLQGHGDSEHGGTFLGWNRNAELALEAFEAGRGRYGDVPRYACGHSFGGVLSGLILGTRPDVFQRAVLLDPVVFPPRLLAMRSLLALIGKRANPVSNKARGRRDTWPDREAAYKALHGRGMFRGWEELAFQAHIDHALDEQHGKGVVLKCRPSREAEVFESFPNRTWHWLGQVQAPTLILHGDASYPFVAESAGKLSRRNPSFSERVVPGGHCFMLEDSAMAAEQTRAFLLGE